jgi:hypothetical protein
MEVIRVQAAFTVKGSLDDGNLLAASIKETMENLEKKGAELRALGTPAALQERRQLQQRYDRYELILRQLVSGV